MTERPFEGMAPADGVEYARWVVDALLGGDGIGAIVPAGFEAYARILHPLPDGQRWSDVAPAFLGPGDEHYRYPYAEPLLAVEGDAGQELVAALAAAVAPWSRGPCHFALWDGWGWMHASSVAVYSAAGDGSPGAARAQEDLQRRHDLAMSDVWAFVESCPVSDDVGGGRPMRLFDGPVQAVGAIGYDQFGDGSLSRQSPQWWWPPDRSWFIATEIDYPWTYLAGTRALLDDILDRLPAESARLAPDTRW